MQKLSDAMAEQFALYINKLGLTDKNGKVLTLTASEEGIYQAGSYYDYLKNVIETSLNNFLADTAFPYTAASGGKGGLAVPEDFGDLPDGEIDGTDRDRGGKGDFDADGRPGGREITDGKGDMKGDCLI